MNDLKIFSGTANQALARRITDYLGVPLGDVALGKFPDGEISCKVNEDIRGRDVFLIQPTCPPVDEHFFELFLMADACRRAGAIHVTAVIPYFGYARQDRRAHGREPVSMRLVADLIATTVERWDARDTSRRIELQVGQDLQYIRINGTVVGGLAGLLIHTVGQTLF